MSAATVEDLAELVTLALSKTQQQILLELRAVANESRIVPARQALADALAHIGDAQRDVRAAQEEERNAKENLADALTEAEWETREQRIEKQSNKTWWVTDDDETEMVPVAAAGPHGGEVVGPQPTGRKLRVQVTADEARDRLAREARKHPTVIEADTAVRKAEDATYAARDRLTLAEKRFSAAKADVQAACAQLTALANTLPLVHAEGTK